MNHCYLRKVGWVVFLVQAAAGFAIWNQLPERREVDFAGSVAPVPVTEPYISPGPPDFNAELALAALSAAVGRSSKEEDFQERIWACLQPLSGHELETLLRAALREPEKGRRKALLTTLFGQLAAAASERALALAGTLPPEATDAALAGMLGYWAERDLPGTSRWYEANLAARSVEYPLIAKAVGEWSQLRKTMRADPPPFAEILTNYQAARAAITPNKSNGVDAEPLLDYFRRTQDWTKGLSISAEDPGLRREIHGLWAWTDPMGWLEWMRLNRREGVSAGPNSSDSNDQRLFLFSGFLLSVFPQSPESLPGHSVSERLDQAVTVFLAEGCDFTSENSDWGSLPDRFMSEFGNWVQCQPLQASGWLKRHQEQPWSDPLIAILATTVVQEDPAAALEWAGRIKDEVRRRNTFAAALKVWRELDPAAADTWAATHPGSEKAAGP